MVEFLKLHSVEEANTVFWQALKLNSFASEKVETRRALGRILSEPVVSKEYLPAFSRSSMDGYAIRAADSRGASESMPAYFQVSGEVPMGQAPKMTVHTGEAVLIHTGGMLPEGADAVIPVEYVQLAGDASLEVYRSVSMNENVLLKGEDVKPGDVVIPAGRLIRAEEIGGLLALGLTNVEVVKRPKVAILSSGDEVIPPEQSPKMGQVRDINTYALSALVEQCGGLVKTYPIIPDQLEQMRAAIHLAYQEADAVIITAGSSTSARDMTAQVVNELGSPGVLVHGINIRPGKPTILAVCDGKPVIGLPGNPVSALVIAHLFVKPLIWRMQGRKIDELECSVKARLTINLPSQAGREEMIPAQVKMVGGELLAEPIFFKSNLIFQLSSADGLIKVPADETGIAAGSEVDVTLI
jgi:molybdopterin molybdotransferase